MNPSNLSELVEQEPEKGNPKEKERKKQNLESSVQETQEARLMRTLSHAAEMKMKMRIAKYLFDLDVEVTGELRINSVGREERLNSDRKR